MATAKVRRALGESIPLGIAMNDSQPGDIVNVLVTHDGLISPFLVGEPVRAGMLVARQYLRDGGLVAASHAIIPLRIPPPTLRMRLRWAIRRWTR